jgi:hypothetical protein
MVTPVTDAVRGPEEVRALLRYAFLSSQSSRSDIHSWRMNVWMLNATHHKQLLRRVVQRAVATGVALVIAVDLSQPWHIARTLDEVRHHCCCLSYDRCHGAAAAAAAAAAPFRRSCRALSRCLVSITSHTRRHRLASCPAVDVCIDRGCSRQRACRSAGTNRHGHCRRAAGRRWLQGGLAGAGLHRRLCAGVPAHLLPEECVPGHIPTTAAATVADLCC